MWVTRVGDRYTILAAKPEHCDLLAVNLRAADRKEVQAAGLSSYRAVRRAFRSGILSRTAFVDGDIAAMWGLGGNLLSEIGHPWLLTTPAVERVPFSFAREAKRAVGEMLLYRSVLFDYVDANYEQAIRFLKILGFTLGEPEPFGRRGQLFRRFELRA
jgi:hypothetical protein